MNILRNNSGFHTWETRILKAGCWDVTFGFLNSQRLKILNMLHAETFLILPDFTSYLPCCHLTAIRRP